MMSTLRQTFRKLAAIAATALIAVGFSFAGCESKPQPAAALPPVIIVSGDTGPWIVPCGCAANQAGGLARRATIVEQARRAAGGNAVYVDVGGAAAGTSEYFREKFLAVVRGEKLMDVGVHNLGKGEIAMGRDLLRKLMNENVVTFLSANARDRASGEPLGVAHTVVQMGDRGVAFVGVISPKFATADVIIDEPRQAILKSLPPREVYQSLVVLAYMPEDELTALAASLPEADAVIGGPTGQAIAPRQVGPTLVASATNKGKFLVKLTGQAKGWSGEVIEVSHTHAEDPKQIENLRQYLKTLEAADIPADQTGLMTPIANPPDSYRIAGSAACITCHQKDHETWSNSKHAHAGDTLKAKGFHVDAYCLQCHTTGFGLPGGFSSPKRTPTLNTVGCESCHGPSTAHAKDPTVRTTFNAFDQCIRCHDQENSPTFNRDTFWAKIKHGKKYEGAAK